MNQKSARRRKKKKKKPTRPKPPKRRKRRPKRKKPLPSPKKKKNQNQNQNRSRNPKKKMTLWNQKKNRTVPKFPLSHASPCPRFPLPGCPRENWSTWTTSPAREGRRT